MKKTTKAGRGAPAAGGPAAVSEAPAPPGPKKTPANLQTAYRGESNAHARYLAFARRADEEGYAPVASLFRAAARAEEIHAGNHRKVMTAAGVSPDGGVETPVAASTRENLEGAIKGEIYERDEMYPRFIQEAHAEGNRAASRSFHIAQKAETEHAARFALALKELERLRGGSILYFVCPVCGFPASRVNAPRCPVCAAPTSRFERIS
jgi:rubrerythrin